MVGAIEKKVKNYLDTIKEKDKKVNAVLEVNPDALKQARALDVKKGKRGRLYGQVIGVKSNINVSGLTTSCASKTLEDYRATYDATVIEKIKAEDGLIIGMLNMDEFACGWSGETSAFGVTDNPAVPGHVAGGSSSGSGAAVAAEFCDMALGSDTAGSIRIPASFCGVVGVKPSYGAVSRYGLVDLSMSLDQIGPLAKTVDDCALLFDVIHGKDTRDTRSVDIGPASLKKPGKVVIGVLKIQGVEKEIQRLVDQTVARLVETFGWRQKEVTMNYIDLAVHTYHPLCWTEFFSATRRFDGRKYGKKIEDVAGKEVLRRIFGGSEIAHAEHAGQYYHKALGVKELIKREFDACFAGGVDCIIMPTSPVLTWTFGEEKSLEDLYAVDKLTVPSNLAETCAISLPIGVIDDKPVGMQIVCGQGQDAKMLSIAREVEKLE